MHALRFCTIFILSIFAVNDLLAQDLQQFTSAEIESDMELARIANSSKKLKRIIADASHSVVHIEAIKPDEESSREGATVTEAGAGIIFDYQGKSFVLTNLHVVRTAKLKKISVLLKSGRFFKPTRIYQDAHTDIAVLATSETGLSSAKIGDSTKVGIGDFVFAVGSPFGLNHSVTYGIVSARGRRNLNLGSQGIKYQDFIQTDAAINPGNSGGPLINLSGEVIGINTAIASNSGGNDGIGFSIPIKMAMGICEQLVDFGYVKRSYLGVTLDSDFTVEKAYVLGLKRYFGARVTRVSSGSPADICGMVKNDLILKFNDVEIQDDAHLVNVVSTTSSNKEVSLVVLRNRQLVTLKTKVRSLNPPKS